ncbi:hypothetical protein FOZ61_001772 [Perkinsus olseni]|uniref:Uncharacterized protein n=1 Tax=Perkinsus olseni TaxID=32597 RepID=A0A7J6LVF4_PEROL|nr:hypothetical protein FOZ61_001772 [Perkinsus olseni]KAF4668995.1 hypothetical protein FOL46_001678 [Perkinsus olseni]
MVGHTLTSCPHNLADASLSGAQCPAVSVGTQPLLHHHYQLGQPTSFGAHRHRHPDVYDVASADERSRDDGPFDPSFRAPKCESCETGDVTGVCCAAKARCGMGCRSNTHHRHHGNTIQVPIDKLQHKVTDYSKSIPAMFGGAILNVQRPLCPMAHLSGAISISLLKMLQMHISEQRERVGTADRWIEEPLRFFDWYMEYAEIVKFPPSADAIHDVLMVGCGNSRLPEQLVKRHGFRHVCCIDLFKRGSNGCM